MTNNDLDAMLIRVFGPLTPEELVWRRAQYRQMLTDYEAQYQWAAAEYEQRFQRDADQGSVK
jgi:hypothetical protein